MWGGNRCEVIYQAEPDCGCTSVKFSREPLAVGKTDSIVVSYDGNGFLPGIFQKCITIHTNGSSKPLVLKIKGHIILRNRKTLFLVLYVGKRDIRSGHQAKVIPWSVMTMRCRLYRSPMALLNVFFAHLELPLDVLGITLVAQIAVAAMVFEPLQQRLSEVGGQLATGGLQGDINLSIGPDVLDVADQTVASMHILEDLVAVDQSRVFV